MYRVLIEPWSVAVKEEAFFLEQGGGREPWGRTWVRIEADSIEHARELGRQVKVVRARLDEGAADDTEG